MLFIGGAADTLDIPVQWKGDRFTIPFPIRFMEYCGSKPANYFEPEYHTYNKMELLGANGKVFPVMVLDGLNANDVLEKLIEGYRNKDNKK